MKVAILSRSENTHADMVEKYCKAQAAYVFRVNFDFDKSLPASLPSVILGNKVANNNFKPDCVFIHHPRISYKDEWFQDDIERKLFVSSWDSVKEWMEAQFPNVLWINPPSKNVKSRNVLRQLLFARNLGFKVPDTIFTNQLDKLRAFAKSDQVVIKQGNLGVHLGEKRILTSFVDVNTINQEMLQGCPCLFQKYIPKEFELRVHVIGDTVLACKIDSQVSKNTEVDWRNYDLENTPHSPYELDYKVSKQCVEIVKKLELVFGIIDLIITPQGGYVFLECNAQGHWLWIEQITGLPITETLCKFILSHGLE